jgi:hypothetical protein
MYIQIPQRCYAILTPNNTETIVEGFYASVSACTAVVAIAHESEGSATEKKYIYFCHADPSTDIRKSFQDFLDALPDKKCNVILYASELHLQYINLRELAAQHELVVKTTPVSSVGKNGDVTANPMDEAPDANLHSLFSYYASQDSDASAEAACIYLDCMRSVSDIQRERPDILISIDKTDCEIFCTSNKATYEQLYRERGEEELISKLTKDIDEERRRYGYNFYDMTTLVANVRTYIESNGQKFREEGAASASTAVSQDGNGEKIEGNPLVYPPNQSASNLGNVEDQQHLRRTLQDMRLSHPESRAANSAENNDKKLDSDCASCSCVIQ